MLYRFSSPVSLVLASLLLGAAAIELTGVTRDGLLVAVQSVLHAGLFAGLAGSILSFRFPSRAVTVMILGGALCLLCLMAEDVSGLTGGNPGWRKDMADLAQRICLAAFLFSRLGIFDGRVKNSIASGLRKAS